MTPGMFARLEAGSEACDELALLARARKWHRVASCGRVSSVDRGAGALQRSVDGDLACLEHPCDFPRREGQHVAKNEDRALSRRELLESDHERETDRLTQFVARPPSRRSWSTGPRVNSGSSAGVTPATSRSRSSPASRARHSSPTRSATRPSSLARGTTSNAGSTRSHASSTSDALQSRSRIRPACFEHVADRLRGSPAAAARHGRRRCYPTRIASLPCVCVAASAVSASGACASSYVAWM